MLFPVNYPKDEWAALEAKPVSHVVTEFSEAEEKALCKPCIAADFEREIKKPLSLWEGDSIPVSTMARLYDAGRAPLTTTRLEKRGVAVDVPVWKDDKCVQCNMCAFACPHAAIRPFLLTDEEVANGPEGMNVKAATGAGAQLGMKFRIQVSPMDCLGCGVCASLCPTKSLEMTRLDTVAEKESVNWDYCFDKIPERADIYNADTVRGVQFKQPHFEFSGACGGCGEAPYIKLLTQMFGSRQILACSSGCNVAYSFAMGSNPYCTDKEGYGPASAHSLFEDTAEFCFGIARTRRLRRENYAKDLAACTKGTEAEEGVNKWLEVFDDPVKSKAAAKQLVPVLEKLQGASADLTRMYELRELLEKASVWCIGGDGWANDIGYGGIDHVIAQNEKLSILLLDTEVYSNTGGQKSKATPLGAVHKFESSGKALPKKELGKIFMGFGHIYVASTCLYSNMAQAMKAIKEAEEYPGPAIVMCYCPCLEHGIMGSGADWVQQAKRAVDCGYWPLYRFNPLLAKEGKNPFQYDGPKEVKDTVQNFISKENRFLRLMREDPERAKVLHAELDKYTKAKFESYLEMAGKQ